MGNDEDCCGNCIYHQHSNEDDDWTCNNDNSEFFTTFTPYSHWCDEHDRRVG